MEGKVFKAVTIVVPEVATHSTLEAAFNAWADKKQPAAIVHIHFFHDPNSRVHGYQIIYAESWDDASRQDSVGATTKPKFKI